MPKRMTITFDDECVDILDRLISKPSKTIFINLAVKNFSENAEGKKFLVPANSIQTNKPKVKQNSRKDNHFLPKDKKVRIEEWS
ncbi:hypothetical protein [Aliarcobacter cryaerophilus]|jgi:hypothetical protein|uniref:hypothetical protein n=1 Tax=Aliarcobacter cryaerophilus TaxID=28198 RepID=UPI003DA43C70